MIFWEENMISQEFVECLWQRLSALKTLALASPAVIVVGSAGRVYTQRRRELNEEGEDGKAESSVKGIGAAR